MAAVVTVVVEVHAIAAVVAAVTAHAAFEPIMEVIGGFLQKKVYYRLFIREKIARS